MEEAFVDVFCDLVWGGGWREEVSGILSTEGPVTEVERECNWALVGAFMFSISSLPFSFADLALRLNLSLFRYLHLYPLPFPWLVVALTQEQVQRSSCLRSSCLWSIASSSLKTAVGSEGYRFCSCPLIVSSRFLFNVSTFFLLDIFLMTCTFLSLSFHSDAPCQS